MPWLAIKLLGLPRWAWAVMAAALILAGGLLWAKLAEDADDKANVEIGRTVEREKALTETLERTETANEAREEIGRHDAAGDRLRYDQCLRTARTPANCQRFLPGGQAD
jgi:hypothetical protein